MDVFIGGDIRRNHEDIADVLRELFDVLAASVIKHLLNDAFFYFFAQVNGIQSCLEVGTDIIEDQVVAFVVDMTNVGKGKDGFTAVAFNTSYRTDGSGGGAMVV